MGSSVNLGAIFVASMLGITLCLVTMLGNHSRLQNSGKEGKTIQYVFLICVLGCLADVTVATMDGQPGKMQRIINYIGNFWLFLSIVFVGPMWLHVALEHILGYVSNKQRRVTSCFCALAVVGLIVNFFQPIVFGLDEGNRYYRGPLYLIFFLFELFFVVDGLYVYFRAKSKGGVLKFFPVWLFVMPLVIGLLIQFFVYGVSTIWPSIAISLAGIMTGLQNEAAYQDQLTGLYNRYYLDNLKREIMSKKSGQFTALMLDMNGFKGINDGYGHYEGDLALCKVAAILRECAGDFGSVIRYAGDEFVILLNTQEQKIIEECISGIHRKMDEYNESGKKEYKLSVSIGYCPLDLKEKTVDEFMNEVDKRMYEAKSEYYRINKIDRRKR